MRSSRPAVGRPPSVLLAAAALVAVAAAAAGPRQARAGLPRLFTWPPLPGPAARAVPPFQRGMTLAFWQDSDFAPDRVSAHATALTTLSVDSISLVVTAHMSGRTASEIQPRIVPREPVLRDAIRILRRRGFRVMLKPHVDVTTGEFRGSIAPSDWTRWHASYAAYVTRMADLAREEQVDLLCIGTELVSATWRARPWRRLIASLRRRFPGPLTYAANWDEAWRVPFWDALDAIGVDAYFPLSRRADADAAGMARAWRLWATMLATQSRILRRPVILTEIGYRGVRGAASTPGDWQAAGQPLPSVQETAYRAARQALASASWLAGVYPWGWGDPKPTGYSPVWSGAAAVLRDWYACGRSGAAAD
jgi:hypothetical protein